jgi:hypothetical protein
MYLHIIHIFVYEYILMHIYMHIYTVTNPMDIMRLEKKNAGDKYASVGAILEDMELLKVYMNIYIY